ncbi:MAG: nucleotide sugar dehydrogenase [Gammaproteobacteria bacterium]|nr:nucleotide sugar dehydrogenase [Gammaproteobacteria bacterium]
MNPKQRLLEKIDRREAVVAIYGLGYVGLPLALRFAEAGFAVTGFDVDADKVAQLSAGKSYIERIPDRAVADAIAGTGASKTPRRLTATADYARTAQADALIICVPTPLGKHREPDLRYVTDTMDGIAPHLQRGQLVALESTTYPGSTEEEILPRIEARGLRAGEDVFLVYSPEREDPGNPDFNTRTIPKVCGGHTVDCLQVGAALYAAAIDRVVTVSSTRAAEMTKLLENIYRAVNIGLVNELQLVADKMRIDMFEVIDAAATKPFGYTPFRPGPGMGGHCLPIDPFYLAWKAKEYGVNSRFIELAGEVNAAMPLWYVDKAVAELNRAGKAVRGASILILGVAYKKNIDDMRESPALKIIEQLRDQGANIAYHDPHVPRLNKLRDYQFDLQSKPLTADLLANSDLVILCTNHDRLDYPLIAKHSPRIIDTRGALRNLEEGG